MASLCGLIHLLRFLFQWLCVCTSKVFVCFFKSAYVLKSIIFLIPSFVSLFHRVSEAIEDSGSWSSLIWQYWKQFLNIHENCFLVSWEFEGNINLCFLSAPFLKGDSLSHAHFLKCWPKAWGILTWASPLTPLGHTDVPHAWAGNLWGREQARLQSIARKRGSGLEPSVLDPHPALATC